MLKFRQFIFFGKKWAVFVETPEVTEWVDAHLLADKYWSTVNGTVTPLILRMNTVKNEFYNGHEVQTEYSFKPVFGLRFTGWNYGFSHTDIKLIDPSHKIVWSISGWNLFTPIFVNKIKRQIKRWQVKRDDFPF